LLRLQIMAAALQNAQFWEASVPAGLGPTSAQNGGSGAEQTGTWVAERGGIALAATCPAR
jgi:hypothetical protein